MIDPSDSYLLIDIGNSRTKWGVAKNGRIDPGEPFATRCFKNNPETLLSCWRNILPPTQVVVANVAGSEIAACLVSWTQRYWNLAPRFVSSEAEGFGVHNAYLDPGKLGVDRWVALIGAHHACPGPVCVADFGTAITMDAINSEGVHLGGVIAPGLMRKIMGVIDGTSHIPGAAQ